MGRGERSTDSEGAIDASARAEIVARLYDVAVDPVRWTELAQAWDRQVGPLGRLEGATGALDDPDLASHARRATDVLVRGGAEAESFAPDPAARRRAELVGRLVHNPAWVLAPDGRVLAANAAAAHRYGLAPGARLEDLPWSEEDTALMAEILRNLAEGRGGALVSLRVRNADDGTGTLVQLSRLADHEAGPAALVVSTEIVWPRGFDATLAEAFGLTPSEIEIVAGVIRGLDSAAIAAARGRSPATVSTQLKSILAKTETHSRAELLRVVLGLMELTLIDSPADAPPAAPGRSGAATLEAGASLTLRDGRRLQLIEYGDPLGRPLLYMHMDFAVAFWPASAERAARARGIRVVVPVRAGYGRSDPLPEGADHLAAVTADYAEVCDRLGLDAVAVLALGADLRFALALDAARPGLVRGILGCAAQLPLRTAEQYDRMDPWQRFVLANARYAPRILPFIVRAGLAMARRLGTMPFLRLVQGGSPGDLAAFREPEIIAAMERAAPLILEGPNAPRAFTAEALSSERDWSDLVRRVQVPVVLLQGDCDPQSPEETIRELAPLYPHLRVEFLPGRGQFLFFQEWRRALDVLEPMLPLPDRSPRPAA